MLAALAMGHTHWERGYVGSQDQRSSTKAVWQQSSLWWEAVTWDCVYVTTSPLIPRLVPGVFSSSPATLLSKGIVLLIVEACVSLVTYQTEVLIRSAAYRLIRFHPEEKPGRSLPQACQASRTEESLSHPRREWCRPKTHLIPSALHSNRAR